MIQSHNDYLQKVPFWKAFSSDVNVYEVDVFFQKNTLYVAHTINEINEKATLESLYLDPLRSIIANEITPIENLILMIDVKSEALATLDEIIDVLQMYPEIITHSQIKIVISGNRPKHQTYNSYPGFIHFDHQELLESLATNDLKKVAMISTSFENYSNWNGKGRLTHNDYKMVTDVLEKVKKINKPFRFWATPDSKTAWRTFMDLGVDIINTDMPFECVSYIKTYNSRVTIPQLQSEVYRPTFKSDKKRKRVKNVILMIGDGTGLSQISSAAVANNGSLTLTQLQSLGLVTTNSADDLITDSAAAGTAIATGKKTNNRAIGTDVKGKPLQSIVETLSQADFSTGIITTDKITGATPASFYAKQIDRSQTSGIAKDLSKSSLDFFVGGGAAEFKNTAVNEQFKLVSNAKDIEKIKDGRVGWFIGDEKPLSVVKGRGNLLAETTKAGLSFLKSKKKSFFLMVEAAQIDSCGHENNIEGVVAEAIDFDRAITEAIKFADENDDTLVIITADHETAGLSISGGNINQHKIEGDFTSHDHTAAMVPLFAYGPKSTIFSGVYDNTDIFYKILECLEVDVTSK
ncbi:alkaline phosphatase [Aquimarina agarilytica]|uniref:alkaline phosphatase n=1 Tax=Aquimarina agarilytica TaxID=1087449 RepID=UPI0005901605|nr:alkaline phosphatase [Aquimarina agarilytica]